MGVKLTKEQKAELKKAKKEYDENGGETGFSPLPAGVYEVQIDEVETKVSTNPGSSGFPFWNITYKVCDGGKEDGRKLFHVVSWSPKALFSSVPFLEALGHDDVSPAEYDEIDTDDFIGQKLDVRVSVGTINTGPRAGQENNNVEEVINAKKVAKSKGGKKGKKSKKDDIPF